MLYNCVGDRVTTLKTVHIILFGDYEVLAHLYGLSLQILPDGNSLSHKQRINMWLIISPGHHCCLWCEVESKHLKLPLNTQGPSPENPNQRKPSPSCSLETLRRDYENFVMRGKGDLIKAKEFNKCHWAIFLWYTPRSGMWKNSFSHIYHFIRDHPDGNDNSAL